MDWTSDEPLDASALRTTIQAWIEQFLPVYCAGHNVPHIWRTPLVGFADAHHRELVEFRQTFPDCILPEELLPQATIVLAWFLPYKKELAATNASADLASPAWAAAYRDTNALFPVIAYELATHLAAHGVRTAADAARFDRERLTSRWSHRHFPYLAGLGTYGINHMLITRAGSCGCYYTLVTDLRVPPDSVCKEESCLYKRSGSCKACVRRCPTGALQVDAYDRALCAKAGEALRKESGSTGKGICGKCLVGIPCAFVAP